MVSLLLKTLHSSIIFKITTRRPVSANHSSLKPLPTTKPRAGGVEKEDMRGRLLLSEVFIGIPTFDIFNFLFYENLGFVSLCIPFGKKSVGAPAPTHKISPPFSHRTPQPIPVVLFNVVLLARFLYKSQPMNIEQFSHLFSVLSYCRAEFFCCHQIAVFWIIMESIAATTLKASYSSFIILLIDEQNFSLHTCDETFFLQIPRYVVQIILHLTLNTQIIFFSHTVLKHSQTSLYHTTPTGKKPGKIPSPHHRIFHCQHFLSILAQPRFEKISTLFIPVIKHLHFHALNTKF